MQKTIRVSFEQLTGMLTDRGICVEDFSEYEKLFRAYGWTSDEFVDHAMAVMQTRAKRGTENRKANRFAGCGR